MTITEIENKLDGLYDKLDSLRLLEADAETSSDESHEQWQNNHVPYSEYTKKLNEHYRIRSQITDIHKRIEQTQTYLLQAVKRQPATNPMIKPPLTVDMSKRYDFFISHASEDKESIARPLCDALIKRGAKVWFDEREMTIGDSLRKKIEQGLSQSRYGIVIISKIYMQKFWTEKELNGLFSKWASGDDKVILPIWHHVSKDEVLKYSPILADIIAFKSSDYTLDELVDGFLPLIG